MKKLFIYIPTYNRPQGLRQQLERLVPQVEDTSREVRLLVSDNRSQDTPAWEALAARFTSSRIAFRRNPGNIQANGNILLGFVFAQPDDYLWILGDNDEVRPDALDYVFRHVEGEPDFVLLDEQAKECRETSYDWNDGWVEPISRGPGFISAGIHRMETMRHSLSAAFFFHNSSFPHLAVLLAAGRESSRPLRFAILPRDRVISREDATKEQSGDYSLSETGFGQLSVLLPPRKGRDLLASWWKSGKIPIFANRTRHPIAFAATVGLLLGSGGRLMVNSVLFLTRASLTNSFRKLSRAFIRRPSA